jgi:Domain of unknown function (DUF4333)
MRRPVIILAASLFAAASLSACSGSVSVGNNLDIDKLESTVATEMQSQLGLDAAPTVTCPDTVPIEKDNVFTCTATLDGESVDVKVTQNDDQGNVNWEVVQPSADAS